MDIASQGICFGVWSELKSRLEAVSWACLILLNLNQKTKVVPCVLYLF